MRGHSVAVCNPAPAPARLIAEAGLENPPLPELPARPSAAVSRIWDVDCLFANIGFGDEVFARAMTEIYIDLIRAQNPDVLIDAFNPFACLAARIRGKPLVTVTQGDFHPKSRGFIWWEGELPNDLPSAAPVFSRIAGEHGLSAVKRVIDLFSGDLDLLVGTPETDPLPPLATATYVGPIVAGSPDDSLPDWVSELEPDRPLIWLYPGNPRYGAGPGVADSIVVIRTALSALANRRMHVVMTMGHQTLPVEFGRLPDNFRLADYLPGLAMAARSDLMIHHGGHSSYMTGALMGTPQIIVPTLSERESNARHMFALGCGEIVIPTVDAEGEKHVDAAEFGAKVEAVLAEPRYREAARRLAATTRRFGGAREAADRIERLAAI